MTNEPLPKLLFVKYHLESTDRLRTTANTNNINPRPCYVPAVMCKSIKAALLDTTRKDRYFLEISAKLGKL